MNELERQRNIEAVDAWMEAREDEKERLIDRHAISKSVGHLRSHGFRVDEIYRCLTRYFYVDLDLLDEVLSDA